MNRFPDDDWRRLSIAPVERLQALWRYAYESERLATCAKQGRQSICTSDVKIRTWLLSKLIDGRGSFPQAGPGTRFDAREVFGGHRKSPSKPADRFEVQPLWLCANIPESLHDVHLVETRSTEGHFVRCCGGFCKNRPILLSDAQNGPSTWSSYLILLLLA